MNNKTIDQKTSRKNTLVVVLALISSSASLMCCALPAIFVMLGFGAAFASLINTLPWIVIISEYKWLTFALAGTLIALSAWRLFRSKQIMCPSDPDQRRLCSRLRVISLTLLSISTVMYLIALSFVLLGTIIQ